MGPITSIFRSLEGQWQLTRTISNKGSMTGTALFTKTTPQLLHYREEGVLTLANGTSHNASQKYIYRLLDNKISVFVAETPERLLHDLEFDADVATGKHLCLLDCYNATYKFLNEHSFTLTYKVNGPQKDYTIHTLFIKMEKEKL
jgi:hypothetical protein